MSTRDDYLLLFAIQTPSDLRRLPERALRDVARELRRYLVESVSGSGGHFAAGIVSGPKPATARPTYSQVFGDWLCDMAERDERLVAITPAMREGSKMERFEQLYPERYFDVAIAEQHSVTFAAGLACEGLKPVVAIYSTFLQRAYDQVVHDVVIQDLPVMLAIDRAGVVGGDGPTHAGAYDVTYLRCLPNIVVMTPADENETRRMLCTGFLHDGPSAVRYPRGTGPGVPVATGLLAIPLGKAEERRRGSRIAFLSFGPLLHHVMEAAEELDATVFNMRFVKPLDEEAVVSLSRNHELLVTVEENSVGGAGGAVSECLAAHELREIVHRLHGDGLMKEIERLLVVDPEAAPEPRAVRREGSPDLHHGAAQSLAQPNEGEPRMPRRSEAQPHWFKSRRECARRAGRWRRCRRASVPNSSRAGRP